MTLYRITSHRIGWLDVIALKISTSVYLEKVPFFRVSERVCLSECVCVCGDTDRKHERSTTRTITLKAIHAAIAAAVSLIDRLPGLCTSYQPVLDWGAAILISMGVDTFNTEQYKNKDGQITNGNG